MSPIKRINLNRGESKARMSPTKRTDLNRGELKHQTVENKVQKEELCSCVILNDDGVQYIY